MLTLQISIQVMEGEAACQKLGLQYEWRTPVPCLSSICQVLATYSEDYHLFADEVEAWGDFTQLDRHGVNCSVALAPSTKDKDAVIDPPADMASVSLRRVYRYTQEIAGFVEGAMKEWEARSHKVIAVGGEAGHEVRGEVPECLLLPPCTCTDSCEDPEQHLLEAHAATILALVRRLQETAGVTVMVETEEEKELRDPTFRLRWTQDHLCQ